MLNMTLTFFSLLEYAFVLSINQFNSSMNSFDLTIRALSLFSKMFCKLLMEINLVINLGLDFLLQNWHQSHWPWKHSTFWSEICFEISAYFELGPAWNEDQLNQQVNEIQRAAKNGNPYRFPQMYVFWANGFKDEDFSMRNIFFLGKDQKCILFKLPHFCASKLRPWSCELDSNWANYSAYKTTEVAGT